MHIVHSTRNPVRKWWAPLSVLLVVFSLLLTGCGSSERTGAGGSAVGNARTLDQIKESGSIRIGVFSDKSPFGYVDSNGDYAGYDVVYANRIGEDLGVEVEFMPVEAASRVEFLQSGKVDLILANFTVTPDRAEKVDFANPYMKVALGVVSPKDALITDVSQLEGKNVIVVKGTTADTYFTENLPEVKLTKFEQYTEATGALVDGRADAWATDNTEALAWSLQNPTFETSIATLGETDTIAPAVAQGNTSLREWINQHQRELGEEQFFHANFEQTLKPVYGDTVSPDDLVVEGGVV